MQVDHKSMTEKKLRTMMMLMTVSATKGAKRLYLTREKYLANAAFGVILGFLATVDCIFRGRGLEETFL